MTQEQLDQLIKMQGQVPGILQMDAMNPSPEELRSQAAINKSALGKIPTGSEPKGAVGTINKTDTKTATTSQGPVSAQLIAYLRQLQEEDQKSMVPLQESYESAKALRDQAANLPWQPSQAGQAAWADSIVGGNNFSQAYKAPMTEAERIKLQSGLEEQVQKGATGLDKSSINYLKTMAALGPKTTTGMNTGSTTNINMGYGAPSGAGKNIDPTNYQKAYSNFMGSPEVKSYNDQALAANNMLTAITDNKPNWLSDIAVIGKNLKAAGLAPVSEQDRKLVSGNPGVWEGAIRFFSKVSGEGLLSEADREDAKAAAIFAGAKNAANSSMKADEYARNQAKPLNVDPGVLRQHLEPGTVKFNYEQPKESDAAKLFDKLVKDRMEQKMKEKK